MLSIHIVCIFQDYFYVFLYYLSKSKIKIYISGKEWTKHYAMLSWKILFKWMTCVASHLLLRIIGLMGWNGHLFSWS